MNAFKCPKCGLVTGGNENFCIECGEPLNITCPECGEGWRFMFDYKFCPKCGHDMKNEYTKRPADQEPKLQGQKVDKGKK